MENIHYDPERILNGFTKDSLKDLAKRLKRRIRVIKSDIIQDILSPPKGKPADRVKIWQEINRNLRKELEAFSQEKLEIFSLSETPLEEQFKVSYMFTLSSNPDIKAMGEKLYCQAQENEELENNNKGDEDHEKDKESEPYSGDEEALGGLAAITAEIQIREVKEPIHIRDESIVGRDVIEQIEGRDIIENVSSGLQGTIETPEHKKRIKTLEKKLKKAYSEGLRTKSQLENLKSEWGALRVQLLKEKEENGKYRNRVRELEAERIGKDKEIEILKKKLQQFQHFNLPHVKVEHSSKIDLAAFQGRKALIFAEHDKDVDIKLNALGIIPIWAMEIDWNRPRRRMSTCQIVLYKMNNKKLKKIDEIRDIARYLNIPCNELLDV